MTANAPTRAAYMRDMEPERINRAVYSRPIDHFTTAATLAQRAGHRQLAEGLTEAARAFADGDEGERKTWTKRLTERRT